MPITRWEELRQIMQNKRNAPLVAGVRVSVTSAMRLGALEAVDANRFPLAQIRARPDSCPFCAAMHEKILRIDQHSAYLPPFHINCRCVVVRLSEDAATPDFDPNDEEIQRNLPKAHFVADTVKGREVRYEALKIPARVEGRDFIFRRVKDPTTGRWVSKLEFRQPPQREMPSIILTGFMPPVGERPRVSLQRIGRILRQLPQDTWANLPIDSIVAPPLDSDLQRLLEREKRLVKIVNRIAILNTQRVIELLEQNDAAEIVKTLIQQMRGA